MSVKERVKTEHTFDCALGELKYCEETATLRFVSVQPTAKPEYLREFAGVLLEVADRMDKSREGDG
jgi:hypothetical protein